MADRDFPLPKNTKPSRFAAGGFFVAAAGLNRAHDRRRVFIGRLEPTT